MNANYNFGEELSKQNLTLATQNAVEQVSFKEVRPGELITSDLINRIIGRITSLDSQAVPLFQLGDLTPDTHTLLALGRDQKGNGGIWLDGKTLSLKVGGKGRKIPGRESIWLDGKPLQGSNLAIMSPNLTIKQTGISYSSLTEALAGIESLAKPNDVVVLMGLMDDSIKGLFGEAIISSASSDALTIIIIGVVPSEYEDLDLPIIPSVIALNPVGNPPSAWGIYSIPLQRFLLGGSTGIAMPALNKITVSGNAPSISSINPKSSVVGWIIIITGSGFGTDRGVVKFKDQKDNEIMYWSDSKIMVKVPGVIGDFDVYVENASGIPSNPFSINVVKSDGPVILKVNPDRSGFGVNIEITGSGLGKGTSYVKFPGVHEIGGNSDDVRISVDVPIGAVTGDIYVRNNKDRSNLFTYIILKPEILRVIPNKSRVDTQIEILGSGFGTKGGKVIFAGGGQSNKFQDWSDTLIKINVPKEAVTGDFFVENSIGEASNGFLLEIVS